MAIGYILLPAPTWQPDAAATPGVNYDNDGLELPAFTDAADEILRVEFPVPGNYASGGTLKGNISMAGANTSKGVVLGVRMQAVTPDNNEKYDSAGYAAQTKDRVPVDDTALEEIAFSIAPNMDGAAAGDNLIIEFSRVGTDTTTETSGDDATGDMHFHGAILEYTTI